MTKQEAAIIDLYTGFAMFEGEDRKADMFRPENLAATYKLKISDDMKKTNSVTALALVCDQFTTWVNEKWFKELKDKSALIYAKDEQSPVYLVRNNTIYAVIMPINLNEKD